MHLRLKLVLAEVVAMKPISLLELGCSTGALRAAMRERMPALDYHGCDVSKSAVEAIGDKQVVCVDLNHDPLPFAGRTFDGVVGSGILEYIHDVAGLLRQVRSRIRPGGWFITSYFNMHHVSRRLGRILRRPVFQHPLWVNQYALRHIRGLIRQSGFTILRELPSNLGIGPSPSIGRERWSEASMHRLRHCPGVFALAHQVVFVARADDRDAGLASA